MITIIKKPERKKVKYFCCPCGCEFIAEYDDNIFVDCHSNPKLSFYRIECPICHITRIYHPFLDIKDIEADI